MAALGVLSHPALLSQPGAWGVLTEGSSRITGELGSVQGWKFCSADEYIGELHTERNSIYFVQGRIPLHSEQIYYKSVLP